MAILKNLLDAVEETSPSLRHVTFYQGGKAYGADLGPFKTPAREDDPRLMPPNFYYDQEDFLRQRQQGKAWHWTALRPEATTGFGLGNPMNLGMSIAVYAAISNELDLPLRFPGTEKTYGILYQITWAEILAKAGNTFGRASPRCSICQRPIPSRHLLRCIWPTRSSRGRLLSASMVCQPLPYKQVSSWPFANAILRLMEYDNITSTIKARRAGFHDCIDTEDMFKSFFANLRRDRVIP